jgi:hypothetical protein
MSPDSRAIAARRAAFLENVKGSISRLTDDFIEMYEGFLQTQKHRVLQQLTEPTASQNTDAAIAPPAVSGVCVFLAHCIRCTPT